MVDMEISLINMKCLVNVKCLSNARTVTVTSHPIKLYTNCITLIPTLAFTALREVPMEHLQRVVVWQQGTLTLRTPGSTPFILLGLACALYMCSEKTNFFCNLPLTKNIKIDICDLPTLYSLVTKAAQKFYNHAHHLYIFRISNARSNNMEEIQLYRPARRL